MQNRRQQPVQHLTEPEKDQFNDFWSNIYQADREPELRQEREPAAELPTEDEIRTTVRRLALSKDPGPDLVDKELITASEATMQMTIRLVQRI